MKAVILNDTRVHRHFGCSRVMDVIESQLTSRGIDIAARSAVRNDWPNDKAFLEALRASDLIVINGEGTCHHGSRHAEKLLRIVEHPARGNIPVALINAIYEDNPPDWNRYLEGVDIIWARDSWSAEVLRNCTGRDIPWTFDLSMSEGLHPRAEHVERELVTIGESVLGGAARELINLARENNLVLLPIVQTFKSSKRQNGEIYRLLREGYIHAHTLAFKLRQKNAVFSRSENEYLSYLLRSTLHITGRFHAACICVTTLTPFMALKSNSWKVEALISDLGISDSRMVDSSELKRVVAEPEAHAFSGGEIAAVNEGLRRAVSGAKRLFDEIYETGISRE